MNLNRGEYDLTVKDQTYTLSLTLDDLATLENNLDIGGEELWQQMRKGVGRVNHVNSVLSRAFSKAKPRLGKKEIEDLIPHIPYPERKMAALMLVAGALNYLNEQQPDDPEEQEETGEGATKDPLSSGAEN